MKTIYSKSIFLLLMTFFFSTLSFAQYKIQGPGISPSKDTVYAGIKYEYRVVNFPNTRTLMWQTLWGALDGRDGESVKITWDNVPQGSITVTGFNGTSNVTMEAKVKISGLKPQPIKPEVPKLVKMEYLGNGVRKYYFTNVKNASSYKWALPLGCCETTKRYTGSFILKKNIEDNNVILSVKNTQAYCKGVIQVQAIIDDGGLYSDVNSVNYDYLDKSYVKISAPDTISFGDKKVYTAEITNINGATYEWIQDYYTVINGAGTNKISFCINNDAFLWTSVQANIIIDGNKVGNISKSIFISNSIQLEGPDVIYGNESVEYTLQFTRPVDPTLVFWCLDESKSSIQYGNAKLILNGSNISDGIHKLWIVYAIFDTKVSKIITKYANRPYSIVYNQTLNSATISRTNTSELRNKGIIESLKIQVYDTQGILKYTKVMLNNEYNVNIDLGNLKKGIYIISINDGVYKDFQRILVN